MRFESCSPLKSFIKSITHIMMLEDFPNLQARYHHIMKLFTLLDNVFQCTRQWLHMEYIIIFFLEENCSAMKNFICYSYCRWIVNITHKFYIPVMSFILLTLHNIVIFLNYWPIGCINTWTRLGIYRSLPPAWGPGSTLRHSHTWVLTVRIDWITIKL